MAKAEEDDTAESQTPQVFEYLLLPVTVLEDESIQH